jgi:hypothetical protein
VMPLPAGDRVSVDACLTAVDRLFGPLAFVDEPVVKYRRHSRNKGPTRFRFDAQYMRNRLLRKLARLDYAESWIQRMGLAYDRRNFRCGRDWRLVLMQHALYLMGETTSPVPTGELLRAPFRNRNKRWPAAALSSVALLAVKALPRRAGLRLARRMLTRTHLGKADARFASG